MIEFILTFFYSGKIKKAPGTFGSMAAILFWFLLSKLFFINKISLHNQNIFWIIFLIAILLFGIFTIKKYTWQFRIIDHKSIVLDEVLGQIIALQMVFNFIYRGYFSNHILIAKHLIFCFVLFRFLDITKPLFIGWCDRNLKNPFGVMFDDLLCGLIVGGLGIGYVVLF
jgi:phosphatidylglycerophosphatase A